MNEPRYRVANLRAHGGRLDSEALRDVFDAPWRAVELVDLAPGDRLGPRDLVDSEVMAFVTEGSGTARLTSGPVELRAGISLTLFKDEVLDLTAGEEALEVFLAEMGAGDA